MSGNPRAKQFVNVNIPLSIEMREMLYARSKTMGAIRPSITVGAELSIQALLANNRPFPVQRPPRHGLRTSMSIEKSLFAGVKALADKIDMRVSDVIYSMLLAEAGPAPRTVYLDQHMQAHAA